MSAVAERIPGLAEAAEPAEFNGVGRDAVRLLVVLLPDGETREMRFADLPELLEPGDLLVLNTSGTRPAALDARREDGRQVTVHLSNPAPQGDQRRWVIELRNGHRPERRAHPGERLDLAGGGSARLIAPYLGSRLWVAELSIAGDVDDYLRCHGRPIRYAHTSADGGISVYQNVYSTETGSAEMPSAGRPFTPELITRLIAKGVDLAPLVLHTGVSSLERGERPLPERLHVPVSTTARVELTRRLGMRVIAVGTTTVRALESAIAEDGRIHPTNGWTDLILDRNTPLSAVDGVLSGFHDPDSSHLELLEAFAGPELIAASYRAAAERGYRRHEFGDVQLFLPRAPKGSAFD